MSATRGLVEAVGDRCGPDRRSSRVANDRVAFVAALAEGRTHTGLAIQGSGVIDQQTMPVP